MPIEGENQLSNNELEGEGLRDAEELDGGDEQYMVNSLSEAQRKALRELLEATRKRAEKKRKKQAR